MRRFFVDIKVIDISGIVSSDGDGIRWTTVWRKIHENGVSVYRR